VTSGAISNYASPGSSLLYGLTGFKIERTGATAEKQVSVQDALADPSDPADPKTEDT